MSVARTSPTISEVLAEIARRWSSAQYELVHACAALCESTEWATAGYATPSHCIAEYFDVELSTGREWIRIGKTLRKRHLLNRAFRDKRLSYSKVKVLTRFVDDTNEAELTELATFVPAGQLNKALAKWSIDNQDPEAIDKRQQDQRGVFMHTEADGSLKAVISLPALAGGKFRAALDAQIMRTNAPAGASLAQQRADGLISLIAEGGSKVKTEMIVHVRGDGTTFDDGTPLAGSHLGALVPAAFIRALIHNIDGKPIDATNKRRYPTDRQKRVVKERDRCCVDCGSTDFLHFDHDPRYDASGHTVTTELVTRCSHCHRQRHRREGGG